MSIKKNCRLPYFVLLSGVFLSVARPLVWAEETGRGNPAETAGSAEHARTLASLLEEAVERNPELVVATEEINVARGGLTAARKWENPELNLVPGLKRVPASGGEAGDTSFKGTLQLGQLIEFPGKRALRWAIAQKDLEASEIAREGLRHQLRTQVKRTFYKLLAAQEIQKLRREQVKGAEVFFGVARKRAEDGYASDLESVRAQADLILAQKNLKDSETDVIETGLALNQLLGRQDERVPTVSGALDEKFSLPTLEQLLELATQHNPSLRVQKLREEKGGLDVEAASLSARPDLTVGPSIEYSDDEQVYGVSASIPLPLWDHKDGEIQIARAVRRKALAEYDKLQLEIRSGVIAALNKSRTAREQLALFTPQFRRQLKSSVDQAESGYSTTGTSVLLYLDAKRTYFETLASYFDALLQNADAEAELEAAVGAPLEQKIQNTK